MIDNGDRSTQGHNEVDEDSDDGRHDNVDNKDVENVNVVGVNCGQLGGAGS